MAKIHIPQRYDEQKQDIYVHLTSKVKNTPLRIKKNGLNNTLTKKNDYLCGIKTICLCLQG